MQHHPHVVFLVETHFDEVIPATKCADLVPDSFDLQLAHLLEDAKLEKAFAYFLHTTVQRDAHEAVGVGRYRSFMGVHAYWHTTFDCVTKLLERVRQVVGNKVGLDRDHTAADVDTDSSRDHRSLGRDYRAHSRTDTVVDVRHHCQVASKDRELCSASQLLDGLLFNEDTFGESENVVG
ncbi:hypothetical protein D3C87_1393480 [compost metagenome]